VVLGTSDRHPVTLKGHLLAQMHARKRSSMLMKKPIRLPLYVPHPLRFVVQRLSHFQHSSGRGGLGNMSRSRSRGPGVVHSTGRGGAGNIASGDGLGADLAEDAERKLHIHAEGV